MIPLLLPLLLSALTGTQASAQGTYDPERASASIPTACPSKKPCAPRG